MSDSDAEAAKEAEEGDRAVAGVCFPYGKRSRTVGEFLCFADVEDDDHDDDEDDDEFDAADAGGAADDDDDDDDSDDESISAFG